MMTNRQSLTSSPRTHTPSLLIVVYAYKLSHIVGRGVTSRTKIELVNEQEGHFRLEEIEGSHPLTQYNIIIDNPSMLGFSYKEGDNALFNRIYDLILAMNLELKQVVLSPDSLIPIQYRWLTDEGGIKETTKALLGMGQAEELNEIAVKKNLKLIYKLHRHKERKKLSQSNYGNKTNLEKALSNYESALYVRGRRAIDKEFTFKTLSTAIELAINWDRQKELSNSNQAIELNKIAGISIKRAMKWREWYPRSKHIDESPAKQKKYRKLQRLSLEEIMSYRFAANAVLLDRLKKVT